MTTLSQEFWNQKYLNKEHKWDIGYVSTPLKEYFEQLENKELRILIPGCGNSYEAEFLYNKGFKNISVIDFSEIALSNLKQRVPNFPEENLICKDFFDLNGSFDLIIEQTFFCAIDPFRRKKYSEKVYDLLLDKGKLVGLLFDDSLNSDYPPFGGDKKEYLSYFSDKFKIKKMERAYNSIKERSGRELFMILERK